MCAHDMAYSADNNDWEILPTVTRTLLFSWYFIDYNRLFIGQGLSRYKVCYK